MASLIRVLNGFYAALFIVSAIVSLATAAGDPAAPFRSLAWASLFALLAILCFVNMRRAGVPLPRSLLAANLAALTLCGAALFAADPLLRWAGGVSLLPFAATAARGIVR